MGIQIQHTQDIEDRLWAVQVIKLALADISGPDKQPTNYGQGCQQGLETTLQKITELFEAQSISRQIWIREDVRHLLLTVQAMTIITPAFEENRSDEYDRGFYAGCEAALWGVATSFGVNLQPLSVRLPFRAAGGTSTAWFLAEDVKNVLVAMEKTLIAISIEPETGQPVAYYQGFEAALHDVAEAFGTQCLPTTRQFHPQPSIPYWFHQAIEGKLSRIYQKVCSPSDQNDGFLTAYHQGFVQAVDCLALSLGVRNLNPTLEGI